MNFYHFLIRFIKIVHITPKKFGVPIMEINIVVTLGTLFMIFTRKIPISKNLFFYKNYFNVYLGN